LAGLDLLLKEPSLAYELEILELDNSCF